MMRIEAREEVLINYGDFCTSQFFASYGAVPTNDGNPHDEVLVALPPSLKIAPPPVAPPPPRDGDARALDFFEGGSLPIAAAELNAAVLEA
jgi:hypothetical protein